ncbi:DUF397 domain-containing protein [Streptomyces silvensis]|uniref:DUF397 domain-containing protein n=1 Tax=Streptomyces silvensis TaxID=1765722 RepID=A0A0W7X157_9ACTN|nr:DUF397 domain-containing protein [Streptomyces silvensis]KUF16580.1 DUF397 domain-containing protein [Streptomyces silvensis]
MSTTLQWYKSSYSTEQGGACLEIAEAPAAVHVRDSKAPETPHLTVTRTAWTAFLTYRHDT